MEIPWKPYLIPKEGKDQMDGEQMKKKKANCKTSKVYNMSSSAYLRSIQNSFTCMYFAMAPWRCMSAELHSLKLLQLVRCCLEIKWKHAAVIVANTDTHTCVVTENKWNSSSASASLSNPPNHHLLYPPQQTEPVPSSLHRADASCPVETTKAILPDALWTFSVCLCSLWSTLPLQLRSVQFTVLRLLFFYTPFKHRMKRLGWKIKYKTVGCHLQVGRNLVRNKGE